MLCHHHSPCHWFRLQAPGIGSSCFPDDGRFTFRDMGSGLRHGVLAGIGVYAAKEAFDQAAVWVEHFDAYVVFRAFHCRDSHCE